MSSTLLTLFVEYGIPLLAPLVIAGVTWALASLAQWLDAKAKESKLAAIAGRVAHLADLVVHDVDAAVRPTLLAAAADGTITAAEGEAMKKSAMDKLKALLAEKGLAEVQGALGVIAPQVETYLSGAIEKAVSAKNAVAASPP